MYTNSFGVEDVLRRTRSIFYTVIDQIIQRCRGGSNEGREVAVYRLALAIEYLLCYFPKR